MPPRPMNQLVMSIYYEVFGSPQLHSNREIDENQQLVFIALEFTQACTLLALFHNGPLHDGEIPDATERNWLRDQGFCSRMVMKGEDGYNACTYRGAWLTRCVIALSERINLTAAKESAVAVDSDNANYVILTDPVDDALKTIIINPVDNTNPINKNPEILIGSGE